MGRKSKINYRKNERMRRQAIILRVLSLILTLLICIAVILFISKFVKKEKTAEKNSDTEGAVILEDQESESSDYTVELQGEAAVTMVLGENFQDPGVVVKDADGNIVDRQVEIEGADFTTAGEHKVLYKISDENGQEAFAERLVTVTPSLDYSTAGLPICMFHYVYEAGNPPENIDANFIDTGTLEEELKYLSDNGYYFPTWTEVREYLEGKRLLPQRSIVITFDDGPSYMELGIPLLEKYQVRATSFVITSYYDNKEMLYSYASEYLAFESHSHNMHRGGGNIGHGGIFPSMSEEEAMADLKQSAELCENNNAFAYPFGDYTAECEQIIEKAGFLCAVTTEAGKCYPGDDPYALKRIRMSGMQTLDEFAGKIQ